MQWTQWVKAHPGQFLSLVGVLFIGVKLLAVSRFQATSALAIATAAGAGEIALAMLVLGYPLLLTAVGCAGVFHFLHVVQPSSANHQRPAPRTNRKRGELGYRLRSVSLLLPLSI